MHFFIMILKRLKILVTLAFLLIGFSYSSATVVTAKLDSVNVQMGRITTLHLSVKQPKGLKGHFPLLSQIRENGIIPVCGDSVELRAPSKIDTLASGNDLDIRYEVPVQAFDSGYYQLPQFVFVSGKDSVASNVVAFKVFPVNATAETPISDFASTADPADPSIFDFIPDWVIDYWWVFLLLILAVVAFIYAYRRYKKEGTLLPKKPEPTPYEAAVKGLVDLKERKLWEQGMEKEYYTELTDILRKYLYGRFGINAMEMTSRQILAAISRNKELSDKRVYFRQILDMADFVKFAKVRPLPDDNILAWVNAMRFVEETKPVPVENQSDSQDGDETGIPDKAGADSKNVKSKKPEKGGDR